MSNLKFPDENFTSEYGAYSSLEEIKVALSKAPYMFLNKREAKNAGKKACKRNKDIKSVVVHWLKTDGVLVLVSSGSRGGLKILWNYGKI